MRSLDLRRVLVDLRCRGMLLGRLGRRTVVLVLATGYKGSERRRTFKVVV